MPRCRAVRRFASALFVLVAAGVPVRSAAPPSADGRGAVVPDAMLRGLQWRSIGPYRGGDRKSVV